MGTWETTNLGHHGSSAYRYCAQRIVCAAAKDYVLGLGNEQVTEMAMTANGGANAMAWQHTNIWAGGKLLGTYDVAGLHFYLDDPLPGSPATSLPRCLRQGWESYEPESLEIFHRTVATVMVSRVRSPARFSASGSWPEDK